MAGTPARTQHGTISTTLNQSKDEKDVGPLAIWSVSSAKPGNGVDLLVDGKSDTFWQSDGAQPHLITLQFQHSVQLSRVAIQTDFRMDESYTPQRIAVRVGTRSSDLRTVRTEEVHEPQGWINIPLGGPMVDDRDRDGLVRSRGDSSGRQGEGELCTSGKLLQIGVLSNHQNGRDTHVRQVRVFGPRKDVTSTLVQRPGRASWVETASTMYGTCR